MKNFFTHHNKKILCGLFTLSLVTVFTIFIYNLAFSEKVHHLIGEKKTIKLYKDLPVQQRFIAGQDNLSQIKFDMNHFESALSQGNILLQITDSECKEILREKIISRPFHLNYTRVNFSPLENSKNKTYCIQFTYMPKKEHKGKRPYFEVYTNELYTNFSVYDTKENRTYENSTLSIRFAYKEETLQRSFSKLIERMSQYKPDFLKGFKLELIITCFLVGTIVITIALVLL